MKHKTSAQKNDGSFILLIPTVASQEHVGGF